MVEMTHARQDKPVGARDRGGRGDWLRGESEPRVDIAERAHIAEAVVEDADHRITAFWTPSIRSTLVPGSISVIAFA